ncbi:MAG: exosortase [Planctomycetota bacterium]
MTSTSTPMPDLAGPDRPRPLITPAAWVWIGVCTVLFVWLHWEFVYRTYRISKDPNWSHVIIIPLISVYYIVQHKARLQAAPKRLFWWALPLVFFGLYAYLWGIYPGRNGMMRGYSMVITIFATTLFVLGPSAMRVLWFPIAYLVFAVKISDAIWERIAQFLQDVASHGATWTLGVLSHVLDYSVESNGNTIVMSFWRDGFQVVEPMNVAEACAGLRMLMAFIALGVALAFLFDRAWWQRLIMVSLAIPIAVAVNIGRVTVIGLIYTVNREYAQGDFHIFVGMLMLIPAAGLFMLVGWVLDLLGRRRKVASVPAATAPTIRGDADPPGAGTIVKGLVVGTVLVLCSGFAYGMGINSFSAFPIVEAISPTLSLVLLSVGVAAFVAIALGARKLAPGRAGPAALTFGVAMVVGIMGTSAVGLQTVVNWQKLVLHKEPVPLRHYLTNLPLEKGNYVFLDDIIIPKEQVEELGTELYINRIYEDLSVDRGEPGRQIRLHVAYYTGLVDTVPHVPDRCFTAGGAIPLAKGPQIISIDPEIATPAAEGPGYTAEAVTRPPGAEDDPFAPGTTVHLPQRDIDTVLFTYRQDHPNAPIEHVNYFFAANGKFLASPNEVRLQGFDLRDTHSYYCKIEVLIYGESDPERVRERTTAILDEFLPEILACLPDWQDVKEGRWPTPAPGNAAGSSANPAIPVSSEPAGAAGD